MDSHEADVFLLPPTKQFMSYLPLYPSTKYDSRLLKYAVDSTYIGWFRVLVCRPVHWKFPSGMGVAGRVWCLLGIGV